MSKPEIWLFCATAPGHSYATYVAINSLLENSAEYEFTLCLSVQDPSDREFLNEKFPKADVFIPDINIPHELKGHRRERSLIHSAILNEGWKRRSKEAYRIIIDNDIVFSKDFKLLDLISLMEAGRAVLVGTEYPKIHFLRRLIRRQKAKPVGVPNCIFCIMDSEYYTEETICEFASYARKSDDPCYIDTLPDLDGCQIDTGAKIYLKPLLENKNFLSIKCHNRFHSYPTARLIDRILGSDISPEFYPMPKQINGMVHHFKKLSIIPSLEQAKEEYSKWLEKIGYK